MNIKTKRNIFLQTKITVFTNTSFQSVTPSLKQAQLNNSTQKSDSSPPINTSHHVCCENQ